MILSFSKTFPWGGPTGFIEKIRTGKKTHTIREDPHNRWKPGMKVHFATGVRTPDYNCFAMGMCSAVDKIKIIPAINTSSVDIQIIINDHLLNPGEVQKIIKNDGFESADDFCKWFKKPFEGNLIHWYPINKVGTLRPETFQIVSEHE